MPLYRASAAIRTQTKTPLDRYGRDTSVSLNGIRGPALNTNEAIRTAQYQLPNYLATPTLFKGNRS
jgi:hypothetical protein